MFRRLDRQPRLWLVLGMVVLMASQFRFGIGVLAWLAPVAWLRFLRLREGDGKRAAGEVLVATFVAYSVAVLKIVTDPVPGLLAPGFALPITLCVVPPYIAWSWVRKRRGENVASLGFCTLTVIGEWCLHGLLPFGTWGSLANTQLD